MSILQNKRALAVLIGLCVFMFTVYGMIVFSYGLLMPEISADLGISMTRISFTYTVRILCGALVSAPTDRLLHRMDSRIYFLVISAALVAVLFLSSCANTYWQFFALAVCGGIFLGGSSYIMVPLFCNEWFEAPAKALGIATAASGLGGVVCPPILSAVITAWGWRGCFRFSALCAGIVLVPVSIFLLQLSPARSGAKQVSAAGRETPEGDGRLPVLSADSNAGKAVMLLSLGLFILFSLSLVYALYPAMMLDKGVAADRTGILLACMQVGNVAAPLLSGFLIPKIGLRKTVTAFLAMSAVGCLGTALLPGQQVILLGVTGAMLAFARIEGVAMPVMIRNIYGKEAYGEIYFKLYPVTHMATALVVSLYGLIYDATGSYQIVYGIILDSLALLPLLFHMVFAIARQSYARQTDCREK